MTVPIERLLDSLEWIPFVTHSGQLSLDGCELRVYRLSNGDRIVDEDDLAAFLGGKEARP